MLAYAYAIIWMIGIWALGLQINKRILNLDQSRSLSLGYPVGLTVIGLVSLFLWQAGVSFSILHLCSYFIGLLSIFFSRSEAIALWSLSRRLWSQNNLQTVITNAWPELIIFSLVVATFGFIGLWLWTVQPVVWDSLVLYDWRAARIADGWSLMRFFQQFTHHSEFYNYDFSHPFLSSIWQAFMHKSGVMQSGLIYLGLVISSLVYAGIIVKSARIWIALTLLLIVTQPMMVVMTQVYSALPYTWFWFLTLLITIDAGLHHKQQALLVLFFLLTTMLNRVATPFWLLFTLWWIGKNLLSNWKTSISWKEAVYFLLPVLAVFLSWTMLQGEARQYVSLSDSVTSRSSYELGHYATFQQIISTPIWFVQSLWVLTWLNPVFPYLVLAMGSLFYPMKWIKKEKELVVLLGGWLLMLWLALIFEISTTPDLWQEKARLLSRVSLPLLVLSVVITVQRWKIHWLN